jgi:ADP-heptose:LPS heptosyltransferase
MNDPRWSGVRRLLAVRLDNLGDVLVTTPAIRALRLALTDANITLLASPAGAQAGRLNPDIDDVLVHSAPWMDPWGTLPQDPQRELALVERLREADFDAAVIFTSFRQSSLPAAYLCYLAGIPLRAAASIDGPGSLLTTRHRHPETPMHEVERGLDLVAALGFPVATSPLILSVPEQARISLDELRWWPRGPGPRLVIHPGCTMPARTYPPDGFAAIACLAVSRLGASVVVTGAPDERELVGQVIAAIPEPERVQVSGCAGDLDFPGFSALIERADAVVTNNTGPMHMAAALNTPVVSLFAMTNPPGQWGPWKVHHRQLIHDVPCRLCYARSCPTDHHCLLGISPERVIDETESLLSEVRRGDPAPTHPRPVDCSRMPLLAEVRG